MANVLELPIIDLSGYINPKSEGDKKRVVAEVKEACMKYGFFQVSGHGISMELQEGLWRGLGNLFHRSKEEKMKQSFLKDRCRRGYESSGDSMRDGDPLPDSKESFYIGREDPVFEHPGFHGPNNWPDLPEDDFRRPIWEYYQRTGKLGQTIWELLLEGLGYSTEIMEVFAKRPIVQMKMIRYPPLKQTLPGQFGVGAHTDFGGVTVLLQQPGKDGLEVFLEDQQEWLSVPSIEDVYIINCGDMIMKWSGGVYRSAKHRVINKSDDSERLSCALFWHGDVHATNPLNPEDPDKSTVGNLLVRRFGSQFSLPKKVFSAA